MIVYVFLTYTENLKGIGWKMTKLWMEKEVKKKEEEK